MTFVEFRNLGTAHWAVSFRLCLEPPRPLWRVTAIFDLRARPKLRAFAGTDADPQAIASTLPGASRGSQKVHDLTDEAPTPVPLVGGATRARRGNRVDRRTGWSRSSAGRARLHCDLGRGVSLP